MEEKELSDISLELIKSVEQKIIEQYTRSQAYANVITLAGYAAFFTILTNVADDISNSVKLISSGMMGISCLVFVIWELYKMLIGSHYTRKAALLIKSATTDKIWEENLSKLSEYESKYNLTNARIWIFILCVSIPTGFCGALLLIYEAFKLSFWN